MDVQVKEQSLSIDDYNRIVRPICDAAERQRSLDYYQGLLTVGEHISEGSSDQLVLNLFRNVFSYHMRPDSPGEVFGALMVFGEKRTAIPTDLTQSECEFLAEVLKQEQNPEILSRLADVLWCLKFQKANEYAVEAINAYIEAAEKLNGENFTFAVERYARAVRILASIKRFADPDFKDKTLAKIVSATNKAVISGPSSLLLGLVSILRNARLEEASAFLNPICEAAEKLELAGSYDHARDFWLLASRLYKDTKNDESGVRTMVRAAETYVKMADIAEAEGNGNYMVICSWLESAAAMHRQRQGGRERAQEIYARLTLLQPKIHEEMTLHSVEVDTTEANEAAVAHVSGRSTIAAILRFALYRSPPTRAELIKAYQEQAQAAPMMDIVAGTYHNKKGHVVARKEFDESEDEKLFRVAQDIRKYQPTFFIVPALLQIQIEHTVSLQEWVDFLHSHPFVPPESRATLAHGLYHGFNGDFVSAAYILVPQLEASLRYLVETQGTDTSFVNAQGLQEEFTLSRLLKMPEIERALGADMVFELRGLLDEKNGANFRHLLLHGLIGDDLAGDSLAVYLYWLVVHLIFKPMNREGIDLA